MIGSSAAGIAHEINNPIGGILLSAQCALSVLDDESQREYVERCLLEIEELARRCGRIVKNGLQCARRDPIRRIVSDLNHLVKRSLQLSREVAVRQGVSFDVQLCANTLEVTVNPTEIEQAVFNLVKNAVEASHPNGRISIITSLLNERMVRLTVTDQGVGLSNETVQRIFEPFYTTRVHQGGSGMGMGLTRGIIEGHGGRIDVHSRCGHSTTVRVDMPRYRPEDADVSLEAIGASGCTISTP